MSESTEQKAAKAILQERQTVSIAGREYEIAPPSIATLIKVSSIVSTIGKIEINNEKVLEQAIAVAPECGRQIAEVVATLILGVHKETPFNAFKGRLKRLFRCNGKSAYDTLVDTLLHEVTPKEMSYLVIKTISAMQIDDFFGVTISLNEINLIRPTREMETTQHGQSSQEQPKASD